MADPKIPEGSILVIEDSTPNRKIITTLLKNNDVTHVQCADGTTAKELLLTQFDRIRGVISDINLPGVDGIELLELVRSKSADMPFVLVTGEASSDRIIRAKELHVSAVLIKPLKSATLSERLSVVFRTQIFSKAA